MSQRNQLRRVAFATCVCGLVLTFSAACRKEAAPQSPPIISTNDTTVSYLGIRIVGRTQFLQLVSEGLFLLASKAPSEFRLVTNSFNGVVFGDRTGGDSTRPSVLTLDSSRARLTPAWCAATLVEEASYLTDYLDFVATERDPAHAWMWNRSAAQKKAGRARLKALKKVGGDQGEIQQVEKWVDSL